LLTSSEFLRIAKIVDALLRHIDERLRSRKFCVIFENELQRVWPVDKSEQLKRDAAIQEFARAHGLSATIHDPGVRVTFRRLNSASQDGRSPKRSVSSLAERAV
jgi:hypothetical protein